MYPTNLNNELHRFGYNARWGYRTDTETGLVYCQNRYYDPANGRWVTRDPIGYAGGVNLYSYCGAGPVGAADWLGLEWHDPGIVYVEPGFEGKVIAIGEQQGDGNVQSAVYVRPGEHTNPHIDVDFIIVISKDGTSHFYAFVGWRNKLMPGDKPQLAVVHKDGTVTGPGINEMNWITDRFWDNVIENLDPKKPIRYPSRRGPPRMKDYEKGLNPQ